MAKKKELGQRGEKMKRNEKKKSKKTKPFVWKVPAENRGNDGTQLKKTTEKKNKEK